MKLVKGVMGAALSLVPISASYGQTVAAAPRPHPEALVGVFAHDANFHPIGERLIAPAPPPGTVYIGDEGKTADLQIGYRSAPLRFLLKPRLTAKLELNGGGRTSFASVGAEWRQHAFGGRAYAQAGIGVTLHNGYINYRDPLEAGLSNTQRVRRLDILLNRTAFGSRVLFNPNASLGLRLSKRYAVELAWEHFSHAQIFGKQNPGMDNVGIRLVRTFR